ncbi:hypothetical protein HK099_007226 [Clydaea vesicula]|uniref:CCHC-type domain-containing protein n=1 Tax=Clydaea vesicula TaxID=447962 RepID=A0AAD5XWI1_9FUNG|nr:hypothetical protein HK099_007226 [Clydaea vesicula]
MMTSGSPGERNDNQNVNFQSNPHQLNLTNQLPSTASMQNYQSIDQLDRTLPHVEDVTKSDPTDPISIQTSSSSKNVQFDSNTLLGLMERNNFSLSSNNYENNISRQFGGLDINQSRRNSDGSGLLGTFDFHHQDSRKGENSHENQLLHSRSFEVERNIKQQPFFAGNTEQQQMFSNSGSPYRVATSTALKALASPTNMAMEHDFLDAFDAENFDAELGNVPANTLSQNAHLLHNLGNLPPESMYFKGYSATPPPDGHWLRNCQLYLERKRGNQLHQQFMAELSNNPASALISDQLKHQYQKLSQQLYLGSTRLPLKTTPPDGYICRKCNTPGHWIQQCPFQKTSVPPSTYTCRICGVKGHWIYQCAHRLPKQATGGVGLLGLGSLGNNLASGLGPSLQTNLGGNFVKDASLSDGNLGAKMADFFYAR